MEKEIYYKVEKIKASPQGYTFFVTSSQGTNFEMLVSENQYERIDINEGDVIDDEHFLEIRAEMLFDNARRQAFTILSYGENNKKMLVQKLRQRGFQQELCENVALYMEHRGYIDEPKQMGLLLDTYLKKKFGRIKIKNELIQKGFKREAVDAFAKEAFEKIDFAENCAYILTHKYNPLPQDAEGKRKMVNSLMNFGYSFDDIKEGIRRFVEDGKNGD
ncbi:MAG: regulatory protein RecX [Clostridia bacterium]|nr:regulatory protein RecX [Clostridia bacterium]